MVEKMAEEFRIQKNDQLNKSEKNNSISHNNVNKIKPTLQIERIQNLTQTLPPNPNHTFTEKSK